MRFRFADTVERPVGTRVTVVPGGLLYIYNADDSLATLYLTQSGSDEVSNPLIADNAGNVSAWLEAADYEGEVRYGADSSGRFPIRPPLGITEVNQAAADAASAAVAGKADQSAVDAKADQAALDALASSTATALDTKADNLTVAAKANTADVNDALAGKADTGTTDALDTRLQAVEAGGATGSPVRVLSRPEVGGVVAGDTGLDAVEGASDGTYEDPTTGDPLTPEYVGLRIGAAYYFTTSELGALALAEGDAIHKVAVLLSPADGIELRVQSSGYPVPARVVDLASFDGDDTVPIRLQHEGAGGTETVDFRAGFSGEIETWTITGDLVITDNGDGTALIDTSAQVVSTVTVSVTGPGGGSATATLTVEIADLSLAMLTFGSQADGSKLAMDLSSGISATIGYVPPGGSYDPITNGLATETVDPLPNGLSNSAGTSAIWDGIKPAANRGFMVLEKLATAGNHGYCSASIIQKAGQELTIGFAIADRASVATSGFNVRIGLAPSDPSLTTGYTTDGRLASSALSQAVMSFVVPAPAEDREIFATVRITNSTGFHWVAIEGIWAQSTDGSEVSGWREQDGSAPVIGGAAQTIYVAPETGSDSNDGLTTGAPKKNPPTGAPKGSTIVLKGGEAHRASWSWLTGGDGASPITLDLTGNSFGTGPAILDGSAVVSGWTSDGGGLWSVPWPDPKQQVRKPDGGETGQTKFSFWQDRVKVGVAQLPAPARADFDDNVDEFALATSMTGSTLAAKSWFEANFTDPSTLVGHVVKVWDDGNVVYEYDITAYDPATGMITFDSAGGFDPYAQSSRWLFAIVGHPECVSKAGQWYRDLGADRLIVRPYGDVDPATAIFDYPSKANGFATSASHVRLKGGVVRGWTGTASVMFENATGARCEGVEIAAANNSYVLYMKSCTDALVLDNHLHDVSGRGIFATGADHITIGGNLVERCSYSAIGVYTPIHADILGNTVREIIGAHANGITGGYIDPLNTTIAFNDVISEGGIALTFQNTQGGHKIFGNTFVAASDARVVQGHGGSPNGLREEGGHDIFCNTVIDLTNGGRALGLLTGHQPGTSFFNNVVNGHDFDTDQRFNPDDLALVPEAFVSGGSGNRWSDIDAASGRYFAAQGGTPDEAARIRVSGGAAPTSLAGVLLYDGGHYPTTGDLPPDLANVAFRQSPIEEAGATPVVLGCTTKPWAPELVTKNANTYPGRTGYGLRSLAELGDIDASAARQTMFVDCDDATALADVDVRPSGSFDLSGGHVATVAMHPNRTLPNKPANLNVSHIGRYKMDGTDIADWRTWLAA